jgi:hypothetical protein
MPPDARESVWGHKRKDGTGSGDFGLCGTIGEGDHMATSTSTQVDTEVAMATRLAQLESPIARRSIERLRKRYAKDLVPIEQLRNELNEALGDRTFKEFLDDARGRY